MFTLRCPVTVRKFSAVAKSMEQHKIIPEVIDVAPEKECEVVFPSGVKAEFGNILTPTQVKDPPSVKWSAGVNDFYTLCVTDPDAPSREAPTMREWLHWLVGNIPGNKISEGQALSDYIGAGPPRGSGLHRYIYLIYKQNAKVSFKERILTNTSSEGREKFSIKKFASKYKLGSPIAGNFYQAEWDSYVPKLFKRIGIKPK